MTETNLIALLLFFLTAMNVALYVTWPAPSPPEGCGVDELRDEAQAYLDWVDANLK